MLREHEIDGSNPSTLTIAYVTQLVEYLISNQEVGGSSPSVGATIPT